MYEDPNIPRLMRDIGERARAAFPVLGNSPASARAEALREAAAAILDNRDEILAANRRDRDSASDMSAAMLDRLSLDEQRLEAISNSLIAIAELPETLGVVDSEWQRPNGLRIQRVRVPLGVIGIIYESRPNVTVDAAGLCIKSGNAVILRGGSESFHSNHALHAAFLQGLKKAGLPESLVQIVPVRDRAAVGFLLSSMGDYVDVIVPRGGRSLVERVSRDARVPVIGHLDGICHVYLHAAADEAMARDIVVNAKLRRTGICGAAETVLVDSGAAGRLVPLVAAALAAGGCEIRGDAAVRALYPDALPASETDWSTEYLDAIVAIRVVEDLPAAVEHIAHYGSGHTEAIVTSDADAAEAFLAAVDSAIVMHNASTQFADGGEFGMGAEIGIATGRIHARGPVGAEQLTSYKYVVRGSGQVRP